MLSKLLPLFNWKVKLGLLLVVSASLYAWHRHAVSIAVTETKASIQAEYTRERFRLMEAALNKSIEIDNQVQAIQKEKDAKIKSLNARVDTLTASVSNRPDRTRASSNTASTGSKESKTGATGLQLYKADAEFLIRFARDTSELQEELVTCYNQYDDVKQALDSFRSNHKGTE